MGKTLILVRHGHRDTSDRESDNGLDDKGKEQAKSIRRFFQSRFETKDLQKGLWIVSSPKVRCVETLLPLAKELDKPVDRHPGLDEQSSREAASAFEERISGFLAEWKKSKPEITIACSHGDWLPVAVSRLIGTQHEFKKGAWLEVEYESGFSSLRWYVPTFKPFFETLQKALSLATVEKSEGISWFVTSMQNFRDLKIWRSKWAAGWRKPSKAAA